MLKRFGADVTIVENGAQAVERLQKNHSPFDLVLMDCEMPVMDGFEATRSIRALGGVYAYIPILALTAHVIPEKLSLCAAAGMDGYITKPISLSSLKESIDKVLKESLAG